MACITNLLNLQHLLHQIFFFNKRSKVVSFQVHKCGDMQNTSSCQPISSVTSLSELNETLLHYRLLTFLVKSERVSASQIGQRKNGSPIGEVLDVSKSIRRNLDEGCSVTGVLFDLSEALDTTDLDILLKKCSSLESETSQITSLNPTYHSQLVER